MRTWLFPSVAVVLGLSGLAWPGSAAAQASTVADRLAAEIRATLPGTTVTAPDPDGLDITFGGQTRSVAIGSVHTACAQGAQSCDAAIHTYAQRAASYMLETVPSSPGQLLAVVRSRSYLEKMRAQMGASDSFVSEPLIGDLLSVCYRDLPQGRRPVMASELEPLKLDQPTALVACKRNAQSALAPLASQWKDLPDKSIGIIQNGDDVTAYLLTPEDWAPLAQRWGGLIIAAPGADSVLYARGANAIDVDALSTLAAQMFAQAAAPVSAQVFRWTDRGWVEVKR
ncbi:MAG TPA: hypothetical protein VGO52_19370 [Hyphomonadaceae bacterium]|jgi:hypothetical protein|nr:hypothetical protein [Hyphomonadaceae bacterium]